MTRENRADSGPVSDDGDRVRLRRERAQLHVNELAELAGVNRDTLSAIEAGKGFRRTSLSKVENALTQFEELHGITAPPLPEQTVQATGPRIVTLRNDVGEVVLDRTGMTEEELVSTARALLRVLAEEATPPVRTDPAES